VDLFSTAAATVVVVVVVVKNTEIIEKACYQGQI
jgi:hypothetical protein